MSAPNPLSTSNQNPSGKSNMRVAIIVIGALHAVLFCGVLLNACKPKEEKKVEVMPPPVLPPLTNEVVLPPPGTGITSTVLTNLPPPFPPSLTNDVPVPPTPGITREHVVTKGDNFSTISKKYSVGVSSIAKANPGVDSSRLKIGQKLSIPAVDSTTPKTVKGSGSATAADAYVVKSGDTLGRIAREHKTTVKSLREANHLKTDAIKVGQKLKLPAATIAPSTGTGKTPTSPIPTVPPGEVPPLPPVK